MKNMVLYPFFFVALYRDNRSDGPIMIPSVMWICQAAGAASCPPVSGVAGSPPAAGAEASGGAAPVPPVSDGVAPAPVSVAVPSPIAESVVSPVVVSPSVLLSESEGLASGEGNGGGVGAT